MKIIFEQILHSISTLILTLIISVNLVQDAFAQFIVINSFVFLGVSFIGQGVWQRNIISLDKKDLDPNAYVTSMFILLAFSSVLLSMVIYLLNLNQINNFLPILILYIFSYLVFEFSRRMLMLYSNIRLNILSSSRLMIVLLLLVFNFSTLKFLLTYLAFGYLLLSFLCCIIFFKPSFAKTLQIMKSFIFNVETNFLSLRGLMIYATNQLPIVIGWKLGLSNQLVTYEIIRTLYAPISTIFNGINNKFFYSSLRKQITFNQISLIILKVLIMVPTVCFLAYLVMPYFVQVLNLNYYDESTLINLLMWSLVAITSCNQIYTSFFILNKNERFLFSVSMAMLLVMPFLIFAINTFSYFNLFVMYALISQGMYLIIYIIYSRLKAS
tara:strand:+ start:16503 stop:17651 length:1149 start_codon:yes stop_codon:yes gene_type:complete